MESIGPTLKDGDGFCCQVWHLNSHHQEWRLALKHKDALDLRFASDAMAMAHENHLPSQMARKMG